MGNLVILLILLGYFGLLMLISAWVGKSSGNDAFFTGNRRAPWYVVSIGMIGSSISGVSFISVPGMVAGNGFLYLQTVAGFFFGYIILAKVLLPVYYKLDSPSIYVYLKQRFGGSAYKTGAWFFLLSKAIGASARVYVAVLVLHEFILKSWGVSFTATSIVVIAMIWLYTFRSGTKTIIWTDLIQTVFMVAAMLLMLLQFSRGLDLDAKGIWNTVLNSDYSRVFEFGDWTNKQFFFKQFFSGIFIVLVMTGLDQEMIQKNRTIHDLDKAQRNMYWYGFTFLPINLILLVIGVLMYVFAAQKGIALPSSPDSVLPVLATEQFAGGIGVLLLLIGVVSATFSGADSSMTAITTSFCIDILGREDEVRTRRRVHASVALLFVGIILLFRAINSLTLIDAIYTIASYTYGPLLGLFAFGMFTKKKANDRWIPLIALASPLFCFALQAFTAKVFGYRFSYELLMLNGLLTFTGLWFTSNKK
ncbi:MAG TPA: sodium:solute symporter [Bacteroidales bacterium]|nr:sodium:solute symporter [Bacteroidales bacterium]